MSSAAGVPMVLIHFTPPSGLGVAPLLFVAEPGSRPQPTSLETLSQLDRPLIAHSFGLLVEWFRAANLPLPAQVLDLEGARRLLVGRPKREFGDRELPWAFRPLLKQFVSEPLLDDEDLREAVGHQLGVPLSLQESDRDLLRDVLAKSTERAWEDTRDRLEVAGEYERFASVEVPVYNSMLTTQFRGFRIDRRERDRLLRRVQQQITARQYGLSISRGVDIERARLDLPYLVGILGLGEAVCEKFSSAREVIDQYRAVDPICEALQKLFRDRRNRSILLRLSTPESEICHVTFESIGTVTARILASDPHVQYLRKDFRSVVKARKGMELLYLDYAHFEPSIMASLSGDPAMKELCAEDDLYEELARRLFGSSGERRKAKRLFLAYSNGMSAERLDELLGKSKIEDVRSRTSLGRLFPTFEDWKAERFADLESLGRLGTTVGNFRYRERDGPLTNSERRWAVNQVVQGMGSLILKRLILELSSRVPEARLLLPMHDALLLEVEEKSARELAADVRVVFEEVFESLCPGVNPRARAESFAPELERTGPQT